MNLAFRLFTATVASTAAACSFGPASYRPVAPHRGASSGIEAEIVEVRQMGAMTVVLDVKARQGVGVKRGLLAPAAASPCQEGVRSQFLTLDGQAQWLRPVAVGGAHRITLTFPAGASATVLEQTPVVDLVVVDERPELREDDDDRNEQRCVRIALSGRAPELKWGRPAPWTTVVALRFTYPSHPVGSVDDGWSFDMGFGRWFGPLRAKLEVGMGASDCHGFCPPGPKGAGAGFLSFPLRASIDGYLLETTGFGIAAEIGLHQVSAARTNPDDTTRWETSRGPRAALRFDVLALPAPGWPRDARQGSFGLEFSLGRWTSATSGDEPALVWGFGIVSHAGF